MVHGDGNVAPAPLTPWNGEAVMPRIDPGSYVSPLASVIGRVEIGRGVLVAPFASVRGDEGGPIFVGDESNIQDGAILHALLGRYVEVDGSRYAIYLGRQVSVSHGAIVHGPAAIEEGSFIGFGAVVFQARIGRGVVVLHRAVVTGGVYVPDGRLVPAGVVIDSQDKVVGLPEVSEELREFRARVIQVNGDLVGGYRTGPNPPATARC